MRHILVASYHQGFPDGAIGKEPACQCRRCKRCWFHPWFRKIPWTRKWQPTPVLMPGESNGQRILVGYSPWGCKESNMTEATQCMHTLPLNTQNQVSFIWGGKDAGQVINALRTEQGMFLLDIQQRSLKHIPRLH